MKTVFVIFFLINGIWTRGEDLPQDEGWHPFSYATESECLDAVERAMAIHMDLLRTNPGAYPKRFDCE